MHERASFRWFGLRLGAPLHWGKAFAKIRGKTRYQERWSLPYFGAVGGIGFPGGGAGVWATITITGGKGAVLCMEGRNDVPLLGRHPVPGPSLVTAFLRTLLPAQADFRHAEVVVNLNFSLAWHWVHCHALPWLVILWLQWTLAECGTEASLPAQGGCSLGKAHGLFAAQAIRKCCISCRDWTQCAR